MLRTLIDADTLKTRLPEVVVLDCRFRLEDPGWGETAWQQGHLPGAGYMNLDTVLSGQKTGKNGRHPLPDPARLAERFGAAGIGPDTPVVAYDDVDGRYAARAWALLRWLGHDNVAVLDGGMTAWVAAGGTLTTEVPTPRPMVFPLRPSQLGTVNVGDVVDNLARADFVIIDARAAARYAGEGETLDPVGGHIPGALNRFFTGNMADGQHFKQPDVLREEWLALAGQWNPQQIVHQCGSGVTACHNLLAMEHAGLTGSRLYPGSWSEWCSDPARPVATGSAPG